MLKSRQRVQTQIFSMGHECTQTPSAFHMKENGIASNEETPPAEMNTSPKESELRYMHLGAKRNIVTLRIRARGHRPPYG